MSKFIGYAIPVIHELSELKAVSQDKFQGSADMFSQGLRMTVENAGEFFVSFQARSMETPRISPAQSYTGEFLGLQDDGSFKQIYREELKFTHRAHADDNIIRIGSNAPHPLRVSSFTEIADVVQRRRQV